MKKFLISIQFLFRPSFWIMNHRYNKCWDDFISYIIDNGIKPTVIDEFSMVVHVDGDTTSDGVSVWLENYPYAYGTSYSRGGGVRARPSRYNIVRLDKYISDLQSPLT